MFGQAGAGNKWVKGHHIGGAVHVGTVLAGAKKVAEDLEWGLQVRRVWTSACCRTTALVKQETEVCDPLPGCSWQCQVRPKKRWLAVVGC